MIYFLFILKSALEDFRRNKLRTLLTSLGILIGVASVVLLMAFGLGLKKYISQQFGSLGTNLIFVTPGNSLKGQQLGGAQFDLQDVTALKKIEDVKYVSPVFTKGVTVSSATSKEFSSIYASSEDVFSTLNLEIEYGNLFTKTDVNKRNKIVVIGPEIAKKLFGTAGDALDQSINIEDQKFKIIGITKAKGGGGLGGPSFDSFIFMPYKVAYIYDPSKIFQALYINAQDGANIIDTKEEIKTTLLKHYKEDDFSVLEQTEILNTISSIFSVLNLVLVAIAAISLIVGGIGIMNIMYVSVVERTREIGIRRALGATGNDILFHFLVESIILSLLGGLLGLGISYAIVLVIQNFFPAYIDLMSIMIAVGVSSLIGITFGVFPARRAAKLSPIEAIRYE
jgi:putative ABC transport system permease protein